MLLDMLVVMQQRYKDKQADMYGPLKRHVPLYLGFRGPRPPVWRSYRLSWSRRESHPREQIQGFAGCWDSILRVGIRIIHGLGEGADPRIVSLPDLMTRVAIDGRPPSTCPPEWGEADEPDPSDTEIWDALYARAEDMIAYAKSFGLTILMLQPLNQFDGWPEGSKRADWVKRKAEKWLPLCSKLHVEQLQVGEPIPAFTRHG